MLARENILPFEVRKMESPMHTPKPFFTALMLIFSIATWGCSPEAIQEPSAPIYGIGLQEAWIPMPDGVLLAADLFVPEGGKENERFPVLLEYLPYRKT